MDTSKIDLGFWFKGILGIVVFYVIYKLLNKFNILGQSEANKEAQLLNTDAAFATTTTDITNNPNNKFLLAIKKKFGNKPTPKQLLSLLPNKSKMPSLITQINDAHNTLKPNDASKVLGAFRQFISQYETNFFATLYEVTNGEDMFGKIDKLLHDSDMATLRNIINAKPVI